ncbi:hypothetical protein Tco_0222822 [Tanacetum coccineum]
MKFVFLEWPKIKEGYGLYHGYLLYVLVYLLLPPCWFRYLRISKTLYAEIEEVNANCILMANLQQALTSSTQTDKAPIYDSDGSAEDSGLMRLPAWRLIRVSGWWEGIGLGRGLSG